MFVVTDEVCRSELHLKFTRQPGPSTVDTDQMAIDHSSIKFEVRVLQHGFPSLRICRLPKAFTP